MRGRDDKLIFDCSSSVRKSRGLRSRVQRSLPGPMKLTLLRATRRPPLGIAASRFSSHVGPT